MTVKKRSTINDSRSTINPDLIGVKPGMTQSGEKYVHMYVHVYVPVFNPQPLASRQATPYHSSMASLRPHWFKIAILSILLCLILPGTAVADSLTVTASVPAKTSDFQLNLSSNRGAIVSSHETITYTITYGWLRPTATDIIVIQATWSEDQSIQPPLLSYVVNSATKALGYVQPQIDLTARTITWQITPMPPGADRTVSFSLITGHQDTYPTPFTISARLIGPGLALPWQSLHQTYDPHYIAPTPTPTPTSTPDTTSTPTPSLTLTPTPAPLVPHTTPPSRFDPIGDIPIIGPPLQTALESIDKLAQHGGAAAAIPVAIVATIPWLITLITTIISLLPSLSWWQIVSLLGILVWRRHRYPWGVVYDAKTKLPLDPVLIILTNQYGQQWQTISDIYGRYQFTVEPGQYMIHAVRTNYTFPAASLKSAESDEVYQDLYHGEPLFVTDDQPISVNIPMDPTAADWNQLNKHVEPDWVIIWRRWGNVLFAIGFGWSLCTFLLQSNPINGIILALYVGLIGLMLWYRHQHAHGTILDSYGHPVAGAIVSLVDTAHPTVPRPPVVTTSSGHYAFLVDRGSYRITVSRQHNSHSPWPILTTSVIHQRRRQGLIATKIVLPKSSQSK